jgi:hypothetical protein
LDREQKVRDGDRRDNADDRHDDQELEESKALLFLHCAVPSWTDRSDGNRGTKMRH